MRTPPYRFTATEGMYAGTTFVYPDHDVVISYRTESPDHYFRTPSFRPGKQYAAVEQVHHDGRAAGGVQFVPRGDLMARSDYIYLVRSGDLRSQGAVPVAAFTVKRELRAWLLARPDRDAAAS